jgi:hypothetical protein
MAMSRKDYEKVAAILREENDFAGDGRDLASRTARAVVATVTVKMADMFAEDNPRFNRAKFLEACGDEA